MTSFIFPHDVVGAPPATLSCVQRHLSCPDPCTPVLASIALDSWRITKDNHYLMSLVYTLVISNRQKELMTLERPTAPVAFDPHSLVYCVQTPTFSTESINTCCVCEDCFYDEVP